MKNNWLKNNWGNIFSVIGVMSTFYFGVFYVPNYLEKAANFEQEQMNLELIQSTKEMVFADTVVDVENIKQMILGLEIKFEKKYTYTVRGLLLQVQTDFSNDRFLDYAIRKRLTNKVQNLISEVNNQEVMIPTEKSWIYKNQMILVRIVFIVITVLVIVYGVMFYVRKYRIEKAKSEEIENQIKEEEEEFEPANKEQITSGANYEESISKAFYEVFKPDFSEIENEYLGLFDKKFFIYGKPYYIYFKKLEKTKVGVGSVRTFLYSLLDKDGFGFFIHNHDLTTLAERELKVFQADKPNMKVFQIRCKNYHEALTKLRKLQPILKELQAGA